MRKNAKNFGIFLIILTLIIIALVSINDMPTDSLRPPLNYSGLISNIVNDNVTEITVTKDRDLSNAGRALVTLKDSDSPQSVYVVDITNLDSLLRDKIMNGADIVYKAALPANTNWIFNFVIFPIVIVAIVVVMFFFIQQIQGGGGSRVMSFGKSRAKAMTDDKRKTTFANVAGLEEEKTELQELVEFLKQPKKFIEIGARIPKGVLLVGPPGTGKTLLAKAVAGEAGVPFFSISGSDFVEMFVGVGASRVRDLFEQAKKNVPCIVFIDEIDAVGRRRGAGLGGGHDEREQTLNQLLVEMDGFGVNEGVIIIAATNRPDILDPALLRPGRFDRRVVVGIPDAKGREEILLVHSKGKMLSKNVELKMIAQTTAGFTGADLENLLNEAALLAARNNKKEIDMDEIRKAFIKVGVGTEKKSKVVSPKDRKGTAYHETGHAILFELLSELDPVHIVSIIPTGMAGGYTMPLPSDDKMYLSKKYMEQDITASLGGRAAEEIVLKDITTGASRDIEQATAIARNMVVKYGMSDLLGPIQFGNDNDEVFIGRDLAHARNYGEQVASMIDTEIRRIIETAHAEAKRILMENINALHAVSHILMEREKITGEEFRKVLHNEIPGNYTEVDINDYPNIVDII